VDEDQAADPALGLIGALLRGVELLGDRRRVGAADTRGHGEVEHVPVVAEHRDERVTDLVEPTTLQPLEHGRILPYLSTTMPTNGTA
jgi:hypothetical protein